MQGILEGIASFILSAISNILDTLSRALGGVGPTQYGVSTGGPQGIALTLSQLAQSLASVSQNPQLAQGYVFPILFLLLGVIAKRSLSLDDS
ncbi:MAG: hypothetical protein QXJ48_04035 [Candidatus Korarchaeum sp.]